MALVQSEVPGRVKLTLLRLFLVLAWAMPAIGCQGLSLWRSAPRAAVRTASGATVVQSGSAQVPAAVTSDTTEIEIPLAAFVGPAPAVAAPRGQYVIPDRKNDIPAQPDNKPAPVVRITTHRESGTAPRAFTPPAPPLPPTAAETARADVFRWFCLAGLAGLIVAGLLAWAQHYLAAVKIAAGAVCLPVLGYFFGSAVAMVVSVGLVALGVGVFVAWHVMQSRARSTP